MAAEPWDLSTLYQNSAFSSPSGEGSMLSGSGGSVFAFMCEV